jgi:hypothetical protein
MKIIAIIVLIIAILLLGSAAIFIKSADNSDARATAGITLLPGIFVLLVDVVLWAIVWMLS